MILCILIFTKEEDVKMFTTFSREHFLTENHFTIPVFPDVYEELRAKHNKLSLFKLYYDCVLGIHFVCVPSTEETLAKSIWISAGSLIAAKKAFSEYHYY